MALSARSSGHFGGAPASPGPSVKVQSASDGGASSSSTQGTSVQVAVRIRPLTGQDHTSIPTRWQRMIISPTSSNSLQVDGTGPLPPGSAPTAVSNASRDKRLNFSFDRVLGPADGQDAVYKTSAQSLIPKFMEGYNVTILAYGQTSSGKSYTMGTAATDSIDFEGLVAGRAPDPEMGIIPRAVGQIFDAVNAQKARSGAVQYTIKASFIEIYNEDLIDLLADAEGDARPLVQIREDKQGHIFWSGLREVKVNNVADVMNHLLQGSAVRRTNETDMNAQSSRSHAIFSLTMTQRKYVGNGTLPPPTAGGGLAASSLSGRTTPSGIRSPSSGLPRPASALAVGGRTTPTGIPTANGRAGSRPASTFISPGGPASRSQSPQMGGTAGGEGMRGVSSVLGSARDGEWTTIVSKFHFVDLAGSERLKRTAAQGDRVKEGISINSGLHALGNVISALGDPAKARKTTHIPYRDSKLTRLLQDSLGGNAYTLMIACVSPTEYNVSETVNTLQYANRARNIKNKAEINEQEIGWDDVDYLQGQVTKLRKELAVLKGAKGSGQKAPLRGIADDAASRATQRELFEEKERYFTLSQKYSQLTAEHTKLRQQTETAEKNSDFLQAAEPIIVEYEKAIDVLEGQINLMKAALAHSEDIINEHESKIVEQDERLNFVEQEIEAREGTLMELRARLAQLQDRESSANTYATELEARLQSYTDKDDSDSSITNELRKEIVRLKQAESTAEAYIKELENRLLSSDASLAQLTGQVDRLERELERRDEQYKELQQRMETLDVTAENKQLLEELDMRDQRVLELEKKLDETVGEKDELSKEKSKLTDAVAKDQLERGKLEDRVRQLEKSTTAQEAHAITKDASANSGEAGSEAQLAQLRSELLLLRDTQAKTLAELSTIQVRYREAQQEIALLGRQLAEAKLNGTAVTPAKEANGGNEEEMEELSPSNTSNNLLSLQRRDSWQISPSRAGMRRPESMRLDNGSLPVSEKTLQRRSSGSFLGYKPSDSQPEQRDLKSPAAAPSTIHVRTRSMSSGQPFVGEFSRGPRPLSLSGTVPQSPLYKAFEPDSPANYERKILSLEKERDQLQSTLKEREDELDNFQRNVPAPTAVVTPLASELASAGAASEVPTSTEASTPGHSPAGERSLEDSPKTPSDAGNDQHSVQVQELLLSLAKKEAAHKESTDSLMTQLEALRTENEALRGAKAVSSDSDEVLTLQSQLREAGETAAQEQKTLRDGHEAVAADLKARHAEALSQKDAAHSGVLDGHMAEHKAAIAQLAEDHAQAIRKTTEEHETTIQRQQEQHASVLSSKISEHEAERARIADEHGQALAAQAADHESGLARLKDEHARALEWKDEQHQSALRNVNLEQQSRAAEGQEERDNLLARIREEHESQLERTKSEYESISQRSLSTAQESHESALRAAIAAALADRGKEHSASIEAKEREHASEIDELKRQHFEAVSSKESDHTIALSHAVDSSKKVHEAELQELLASHSKAISELVDSHAADLKSAQDEKEAALRAKEIELKKDHASSSEQLKAEHTRSLDQIKSEQEESGRKLLEGHAAEISRLEKEHQTKLEGWEETHNQFLNELKEQNHRENITATGAFEAELKVVRETADKERENLITQHESKIAAMTAEHEDKLTKMHEDVQTVVKDRDNLRAANTEFQKRHELLQGQLEVDPVEMDMLKAELAETSDALVVLEGALTEAQAERDQLATELAVVREGMDSSSRGLTGSESSGALAKELEQQRSLLAQARNDLLRSKADLQALSEERTRQDILLREAQMKLSAAEARAAKGRDSSSTLSTDGSPIVDGPIANGGARSVSRTGLASPDVEQIAEGSGFRSFSRASQNTKPPPPTPPPNMPPPPTPTMNGGNSARNSAIRRTSAGSLAETVNGLSRSGSLQSLNNASDAKGIRSSTDHAEELKNLQAQLAHCEADLQANIDLVATLEAALNDSERNLRKSRVQLSEVTRERDRFASQAGELQSQVKNATAEVERVRNSVILEKQDYESKIQEERQAKEKAKEALEARLEEVSRKKQSSRLFCM